MFENPAAPLTKFITRVVVSWQQLADELELSWGLESGRHALVNLSSVLVLLLLLVGGRTMRQQQQRRVVALAIALASKCTFTGQISSGDVTVYCQGGHINGGALLAILFPTSAGALEKLAHQWNVDLTNTPLIVVAMLVHRVTLLMKTESKKTRSFGRDAIRLCLKMLSEAMRASPTWLLQTPPANALLSFTFHSGRSCTRLEPRARAMNMLAAGAKDVRGRRSREAGIENLLYLKQAQELFKMIFEHFHTLSVVLDAASFRNSHILQIFAAATMRIRAVRRCRHRFCQNCIAEGQPKFLSGLHRLAG